MSAVADITTDPATDPATALEAELNDVAGHLNAQHGRLVDLTITLLADKSLWQGPGVWTMPQYLAWRVGVSPSRAQQIVAIAERAEELPACVDALRRGELSIDQVAAVVTRTPWWADPQMSGLAKGLTVAQIRRTVSKYRFPHIANPDADEPDIDETGDAADTDEPADASGTDATDATGASDGGEPAPRDVCRFHTGDDDRFRLHLETDAHTGQIITAALGEARDTLFQAGQPDVGPVDALREVCQRSLDTVTDPARRDRHRITLHLATDATATDAVGWVVPDEIRRHLTCDGLLEPVFTHAGRPTSVGRRRYVVPARTRRLIIWRDHGCRVPGCSNHRYLEVHHIIHWLDHGPTDTWNLVALCPHHHHLHHQHQLGITGNADDPDGVTFSFANGEPIARSGARPQPPGAPPPTPAGVYQHPYGERLHSRWLYFNPPLGHRN